MMRKSWALLLAASFILGACGSDPADRQAAVTPEDRRLGAEQHPLLLAEFGGSYDGPEAAYTARIGEKLAAAAGLPGQCTFTLVNSDVVNAFAVPGCYIYVTRGLMGIVNSEAELGSVLAHELGHIVANHSGRQQNRAILRQLGVIAVGLLTGNEDLTRLAGQAAEFFTLRYSRKQEYESDDLGIRYLTAAGYDPYEAADMLGALTRQERFLARTRGKDEAKGMPEWARTHPLTANRIERARKTAAATGKANDALPEGVAAFLTEVDGLLYGDDPQQGFILGRRFLHPIMRIAFEAPPGFTLTNSPRAILLEGPDGMRGEFGGGRLPAGGLEAYVQALAGALLGEMPAEFGEARRGVANGMNMLVVPILVQTREGAAQLAVAAYEGPAGSVYHFVVAVGPDGFPAALDALFGSFRLLSAQEASSLRPRWIRVVAAGPGDTPQSLAGRMGSDHPLDLFLTLNDRSADTPLRPGERVKIVVNAER